MIKVETGHEVCAGKPRLRRLPLYLTVGAMAVSLAIAVAPSQRAQGREGIEPSPLEVIADAVLIDGRCGDAVVDMGALFQYGEQHGYPAVDILPLGGMRKTFEAVLARRSANLDPHTQCSSMVEREQDLAPGVVRRP